MLTQYKSHSLQKHLRDAWSIFSPELGEYITAIPPQMRTGDSWYKGTADAIYQNHFLLERSGAKRILILSGDHIYRMDYAAMLRKHDEMNAGLTVACMRVPLQEATGFGVVSVDADNRILEFNEKPAQPQPMPGHPDVALASMGIYVFDQDVLEQQLGLDHQDKNSSHDFGHDIIPKLIESQNVYCYQFGSKAGRVSLDRYWKDVGTIDSYFDVNMDLLATQPPLDLYQNSWPIRTYHGQHPPARMVPGASGGNGSIQNSMIGSGSLVVGAHVKDSILSARVRVADQAQITSSILFDSVKVGEGAKLNRCIVDKHVEIPAGYEIGFNKEEDAKRFRVSANGVVVVPKTFTP